MSASTQPGLAAALLLSWVAPAALLALPAAAPAQTPLFSAHAGCGNCPPAFNPGCQTPPPQYTPTQPTPPNPANPNPAQPNPVQPNPAQPNPSAPEANVPSPEVDLSNEGMGARGTETVALSPGGYIDDAIPQTLFRLRYDYEDHINRFDRAQFMFATWREASFHTHALVTNGNANRLFLDTKARGPQTINDDITVQDLSAYLEYAVSRRLSAFVDVPYQFVHFGADVEENPREPAAELRAFPEKEVFPQKDAPNGFSDMLAGFKYALIEDPNNRYVTFQFRTYIPTGDPGLGLGTGHWSVEPGLLFYQRLSDRLVLQGEWMDWIPISAGPGAGNVMTYGLGLGYDVIQRCNLRVTPVAEFVGWTVFGGAEAVNGPIPAPATTTSTGADAVLVNGVAVPDDHGFNSSNGDTIVNAKIGVRTYFGQRSDLYVGYGRALTGTRWYQDIYRVEYRIKF